MEHLPIEIRRKLFMLSDAIGLNVNMAAFLTLLLCNLCLAVVFKQLRNPLLRSFMSLSVGLGWCAFLYDIPSTVMLLVLSNIVYLCIVRALLSPAKFTVLAVAVLSGFHIYRMMVDYLGWSLDVTGPLMLFTAKYTMFAYDVEDGRRSNRGEALAVDQHIIETRERTCLVQVPTMFEFNVFVFDFLGVLAGPVFHIREYLDFINLRGDFAALEHVGLKRAVTQRFCTALVLGAVYGISGEIPALSFDYLWTKEHKQSIFIIRLLTVHFITFIGRMRYYFAWYMAETACLIAGLGYNPSNRNKFSRAQNAEISKVDWATCQSEAASHWNISISKWLRSCIYLRANEAPMPKSLHGKLGHRQYATLLTRFTSAFWHGFYPGYYLCFVSTVLQFEADSIARKYIRPLFTKTGATKPYWIYTLVGRIHTALCLNYYGSAFLVLSASAALEIWADLFYCIHIFNIATIVFVPFMCKRLPKMRPIAKKTN